MLLIALRQRLELAMPPVRLFDDLSWFDPTGAATRCWPGCVTDCCPRPSQRSAYPPTPTTHAPYHRSIRRAATVLMGGSYKKTWTGFVYPVVEGVPDSP